MREVYLLSGLGADKRVFDFIDFSDFRTIYIDWIDPVDNESIENYAKRLSGQITTTRPVVIGVSFGGIMTVEVAKQIETEKIILISSAKTKYDIPFYFRLVGLLKINRIIPTRFFKTVNGLTHWFFGTKTTKEKKLLTTIIQDTDTKFMRWAIDKIVNWKNTTILTNLTHVHGTNDKILPLKTADNKIINGGHLMIINKGEELSGIIKKVLS